MWIELLTAYHIVWYGIVMRTSKERWLEEGLKVLAESGVDALTIDTLSNRLHVTKGSFYHHFKDRKDFTQALLAYWEEQFTSRPIQLAEEGLLPRDSFEILCELAAELPRGPEVAIRGWGLCDPMARHYLERVDQRRLEYLTALMAEIVENRDRAPLVAEILMALYVGSSQVVPNIEGQRLREMIAELRDRLM